MAIPNQENGQWKKGQSGNPEGRPPIVKELKSFLQERLSEPHSLNPKKNNLETIAGKLFQMGQKGNLKAIELIFNYAYGKPKDANNESNDVCRVIMPKPIDELIVTVSGPKPPED